MERNRICTGQEEPGEGRIFSGLFPYVSERFFKI